MTLSQEQIDVLRELYEPDEDFIGVVRRLVGTLAELGRQPTVTELLFELRLSAVAGDPDCAWWQQPCERDVDLAFAIGWALSELAVNDALPPVVVGEIPR